MPQVTPVVTVLLVFACLLAGCSKPVVQPETEPPEPVLQPPRFDEAVGMPQNLGSGEPNIAILPDGTLFVTAPAGGSPKPNAREGAAYLWRSQDNGTTWQVLRSPELQGNQQLPFFGGAFCSCDADVVTSQDGWVYYSDWWIAGFLGPGNYMVERSSDSGDTWEVVSITIPTYLQASVDRQWLVAGPDGFVGLFFSFFSQGPFVQIPGNEGQAIQAIFSSDHGATWGDPVVVVPNSSDAYQIAHPFMAPNGTLMMPYGAVHVRENFWYDPSEVRLAYSNDNGESWTTTLVAEVPEGFDNLWAVQGAVDDSTGQTTIVWAGRLDPGDQDDSRMALWVQQFGPLGNVGPVVVRSSGLNFLPWAAARDGQVAVGWYGGNATGDMTEADSDAEWHAYVGLAPDGLFLPGKFTVSTVSELPVKIGPICPKGASCGGDRELLDYVSMVFDADGLLHYAFARSESDNGHIYVANQVVSR